jgi:pimeloyl-ACP methyl ester carboxylesterase
LGSLLSAVVVRRYLRDIQRARERVASGSKIAETQSGPIEYALAGQGPPVLVVHGAGGGFDQGLEIGEAVSQRGFQIVAPSRFGYLRTPLPLDASAAAQADAHAALLQALGIPRAAVVGASAGAPSAMQFALRHPDRTASLVLLVPAAYPFHVERTLRGAMPKRLSTTTAFFLDTTLRSDFLFWLMCRIARRVTARAILATPPTVVESASAEEQARAASVIAHILPVSLRRLGLRNDALVTGSLPRYDLERIAAPTLVISLADDLFGTYDGARYSAEHIPRARFIGFQTGGHLWVGHQKEVLAEIAGFLRDAA